MKKLAILFSLLVVLFLALSHGYFKYQIQKMPAYQFSDEVILRNTGLEPDVPYYIHISVNPSGYSSSKVYDARTANQKEVSSSDYHGYIHGVRLETGPEILTWPSASSEPFEIWFMYQQSNSATYITQPLVSQEPRISSGLTFSFAD
jgi:hypothetical protein